MQSLITAIGKWKRAPEQALFEHYSKRLRGTLELRELTGFPHHSDAERKTKETTMLFESAKSWQAEKIICVDETGKACDSQTLAAYYSQWQDAGIRQVAWLIGGDNGFDKSMLPQADCVFSFGRMTWPHLLMRVLIAEQLYRVHAINTNHPYHRDG